MFDQLSEHFGPAKLTHEINRHSYFMSRTDAPLSFFFLNPTPVRFEWMNISEHTSCIKYWGRYFYTYFIDTQDNLVGEKL